MSKTVPIELLVCTSCRAGRADKARNAARKYETDSRGLFGKLRSWLLDRFARQKPLDICLWQS